VCAAGAVIYSQGWNIHELVIGQRAQQYRIEQKLLAATGWKPRSAITLWNDQVGRTQEEVTDLFMKAEKIERSGDVRD
jgi:hypothetical protein